MCEYEITRGCFMYRLYLFLYVTHIKVGSGFVTSSIFMIPYAYEFGSGSVIQKPRSASSPDRLKPGQIVR